MILEYTNVTIKYILVLWTHLWFAIKKYRKKVQPDWIHKEEFQDFLLSKNSKRSKEKLFRLFCAKGKLMNMEEKSTKSPPKCVMFHHKNPFLKLGPFHTEIISFQPYRAMFHNVSKYIYKYITIHTYLCMYIQT